LGSEGELPQAVDQYLDAALISSDPAIAQRATRIAFAAESWQQAAMAADRWAVLAPSSVPAQESAATAMLRVGDFFGAEYPLSRILEIQEDSVDSWVLVSRILSQSAEQGPADEAMVHLQGQRPDADPATVFYARSQLAATFRDLESAFEFARKSVELEPERAQFLTWAGRIALNLDLQDTGLEYVRRAWELDSENHDLTLAYADLLARNGDENGARNILLEMNQTPDVKLSRVLFELATGNRLGAETAYGELTTMDWPDRSEKAFYEAQAAEALGLREQAIQYYAEVTEGNRALASRLRRAELIALEGDMPAARAALAQLRAEGDDEQQEQAWLTEARILREADERLLAFDVLDEAVAARPGSVALLYSRALLAAESGLLGVAERDLRTIIAAQPENEAALNALGYTLADQTDRLDEAEALIRQAYILQPNEAAIVDSMGWVAFRQGRLEQATQVLARAWTMDRNPEIAAHLGEVLWTNGKREEAVRILREGAEIDPENPVLLETLNRLGITL
jgi:tetratricopeptide (TPR) repeat protein